MRYPLLCLLLLTASSPVTRAQAPPPPPATVPVLMLSDVHFDPFRNITDARLQELLKDAPEHWASVLGRPISAAEQADVRVEAKKQSSCDDGKIDTDYTLFKSSIVAEQADVPAPVFVTVSGDLTTHNFNCKYYSLVKDPPVGGLSDFAAKTAEFVALMLNAAFPKSPIYLSLGNNDSSCRDYAETEAGPKPDNTYFNQVAKVFATVALDSDNAKSILATFPTRGDYTVLLPKPFVDTRLIVLQDLFESAGYGGPCSGTNPNDPTAAQIAWLKTRLDDAKVKHFWIMAHIPPGVDPYNTIHGNGGCPADNTLTTDDFADTLRDSTSDIGLVLYGHTHMDEMRLIVDSSGNGKVAGRLNPSITAWNKNYPSFTVAQIDPTRALLVDFTVYRSSDKTGNGNWDYKYTYSDAYGQPDYSAASLTTLTNIFKTRPTSTQVSNYQKYYQSSPATSNWHAYVCAIVSDTPDKYNTCNACGTPPPTQ
jgi:sphingomyelin phosphodiesterase acid-like 3